MTIFLSIYFALGAIIAGIVMTWAKNNGEEPTMLDFVVWATIYPYYIYKMLRNK